MKLEGVYTALITPFKDGAVDLGGLRANIRFQIQGGAAGVLALGTTGETPTLSRSEQDQVISAAVDEADGKVPVIVGTGTNCTASTVENSKRARELGADMALVVAPYYNKPTQGGILKHFEAVAVATDLPLMVYNIKGRTGVNIETSTLMRLAEIPSVAAVKEASGDIEQIGAVLAEIRRCRSNLTLLSGDDQLTLPIMALGGSGVVSVVSNLVPDRLAALTTAALQGDFASARREHFALLPLFRAAFVESNPIPIKAALEICGHAAGSCRLPLCEAQEATRRLLKEVVSNLKLV